MSDCAQDNSPNSTLMARKLRSNHRVLCASPAYLGKHGVPRRPEDLRRHDCIIFGPSLEGVTWTLEGPGGSELIPVTGRVAVNTMHFALEAAVAGLGIAQLPLAFAESEIGNGRLTVVLERYSTAKGGFYAVYPSARHLSVAVKAFIDFAAERFAERPDAPAALAGSAAGNAHILRAK